MLASKRFTIVPLDLFEEEQADLLFYHNHQKRENETVIYNILKKNNVVIVFGIDRSAYSFLTEQYPEARFYSQSTPLIEYFSVKADWAIARKCMFPYVRKASTSIVSNGDISCLLILSSAPIQKIVFTICCMRGNN